MLGEKIVGFLAGHIWIVPVAFLVGCVALAIVFVLGCRFGLKPIDEN